MTSHHDVAGVVAQLRAISGYPIFRDFGDGATATTSLRTAADLLESQAKALSEAEAESKRNAEGFAFHAGRAERERDRALAAEARLADKEAELSIARQINHDLTDGITGTLQKDKIESLETRLAEAMKVIERDMEALTEADTQIEYLHDKFKPTGSGATAIARIDIALTAARAFTNAAKTQESKDA